MDLVLSSYPDASQVSERYHRDCEDVGLRDGDGEDGYGECSGRYTDVDESRERREELSRYGSGTTGRGRDDRDAGSFTSIIEHSTNPFRTTQPVSSNPSSTFDEPHPPITGSGIDHSRSFGSGIDDDDYVDDHF